MKKWMIGLTFLLLAGCNSTQTPEGEVMDETSEAIEEAGNQVENALNEGENQESMVPEVEVTEIELDASNFTFGQDEIRVKEGETVRITINNTQGTHDFVIDELEVNSGIIPEGESQTVEFTAWDTGSWEYYCSVGNHRQLGMKGILVVE